MSDSEEPRLWFRVLLPSGAFGPGKAELLAAIDSEGSISGAGRRMRMSYKRAWRLVDELNGLWAAPLVETERGGEAGGGARLTPLGREVIELYRGLESELEATGRPWLEKLAEAGRG